MPRIRLPEQFDIASVSRVCNDARTCTDTGYELDASAVSRTDCVALQLLLALKNASGSPLVWTSRSKAIAEAARVLDLENALDLHTKG